MGRRWRQSREFYTGVSKGPGMGGFVAELKRGLWYASRWEPYKELGSFPTEAAAKRAVERWLSRRSTRRG